MVSTLEAFCRVHTHAHQGTHRHTQAPALHSLVQTQQATKVTHYDRDLQRILRNMGIPLSPPEQRELPSPTTKLPFVNSPDLRSRQASSLP